MERGLGGISIFEGVGVWLGGISKDEGGIGGKFEGVGRVERNFVSCVDSQESMVDYGSLIPYNPSSDFVLLFSLHRLKFWGNRLYKECRGVDRTDLFLRNSYFIWKGEE